METRGQKSSIYLLFLLTLQPSFAQRCYECSSSYQSGCGNPFTLTSTDVFLEQCSIGVCATRIETSGGSTVYTRGCSFTQRQDGCFTTTRGHECYCSGDLCNTVTSGAALNIITICLMLKFKLIIYLTQ